MKKLKNYLPLLLMSFFLFQSCQTDDITDSTEEIVHDPHRLVVKTESKSINEFHSNHFIQSEIDNIINSYNQSIRKSSSNDSLVFRYYMDQVEYRDYIVAETYTLRIERPNPQGVLENLIMYKDTTSTETKYFIASYLLEDENYNDIKYNQLPNNIEQLSANPLDTTFVFTKCERVPETRYKDCGSGAHNRYNIDAWNECKLSGDDLPSAFTVWSLNCDAMLPQNTIDAGDSSQAGGQNRILNGVVLTNPNVVAICVGPVAINTIGSGISSSGSSGSGCMTAGQMVGNINSLLTVDLTIEEKSWILASSQNAEKAYDLYKLLEQNQDPENDYAELAFRLVLKLLMDNIDGFTPDQINTAIEATVIGMNYAAPEFMVYFSLEYAALERDHDDWSRNKLLFQAGLASFQTMLDLVGLVPGAGEFADIANGLIYTANGDGVNASLSFGSAIPFVGWGSTGIKAIRKYDRLTRITFKVSYDASTNVYKFVGRSGKLRKALGLAPGDPRKAHHLIPQADRFLNHPVVQKAAGQGFHIDEALNGIPVSTATHNAPHINYSDIVYGKLENFIANNPNASGLDCYNYIVNLTDSIRTWIIQNPGLPLNQINF